jgi:hypothetical protein
MDVKVFFRNETTSNVFPLKRYGSIEIDSNVNSKNIKMGDYVFIIKVMVINSTLFESKFNVNSTTFKRVYERYN